MFGMVTALPIPDRDPSALETGKQPQPVEDKLG
jgi:hypothetical protein